MIRPTDFKESLLLEPGPYPLANFQEGVDFRKKRGAVRRLVEKSGIWERYQTLLRPAVEDLVRNIRFKATEEDYRDIRIALGVFGAADRRALFMDMLLRPALRNPERFKREFIEPFRRALKRR